MIIVEIREGVFAQGFPGRKAKVVLQRRKGTQSWMGVRGRRPTIPSDAKRATGLPESLRAAFKDASN